MKKWSRYIYFSCNVIFITLLFTEEDAKDKGKLYKPTSKLAELAEKFSSAEKAAQFKANAADRLDKPAKKKEKDKKKTNLELFKEELKM